MSRLFGTDGVRGVANIPPMDSETVMRLGRAVAHVVRRRQGSHRVLIGKDTRLSGYMLETALESGIASMGVDVLLVGPLPTPAVAYLTRSMRADAGVMISASHNSYEDNGIKFFAADGFKLADKDEDEIERLMQPGHLDEMRASPDVIGKMFRMEDAIGRYIVYLKSCLDKGLDFEGMRFVVDTAHGAAYRVAPQVFAELGAEIALIGAKPDGKNINLGCGSTHTEQLVKSVVDQGAACGVAYDGDADRVIFCDENGELFDGDQILAMCALEMKREGKLKGGAVAGTAMSNFGLERLLKENGISLVRCDVGDRYVLEGMQQQGLNLGGEQSGHVIFLDHSTTGDGILSSLMVLSILKKSQRPLSSFGKLFERCPQILQNVAVRERIPFENLPQVQLALKSAKAELEGRGRVLLRYSGTERKARVMVECDEPQLCQRLVDNLVAALQKELN